METETATEQRDVFANVVRTLLGGRPRLEVRAPRCIEVNCYERRDLGATLIYFLNSQASAPPVPVHDISVAVADAGHPASVRLVPEGKELDWEPAGSGLQFQLPTCEALAVVRIDW